VVSEAIKAIGGKLQHPPVHLREFPLPVLLM
jgi:hypothetical protein